MENKTVLITIPFTQHQQHALEQLQPHWQYIYNLQPTTEEIAQANIMLGKVSPPQLTTAKQLEWLQLDSAGADLYTAPGVLPPNVVLTNAVGAYGTAVSEHLMAMFFSLQKKLHLYRDNQNNARWQDEGGVNALHGLNVLVIGLGDIGGSFAKKMHVFGNTVCGIRRDTANKPEYIKEIYPLSQLDTLLPEMDVVALCLPGSPKTVGLISAKQLALMKQSAILLNGGRGNLIDTNALYHALLNRQIYAAGLDVTDPEPLPADHKLWQLPNILITPHISGQYHLQETLDNIVRITLNNFERYIKKEPLINQVAF